MTAMPQHIRRFPFPPAIPLSALLLAWLFDRVLPLPIAWPVWTLPLGICLIILALAFAVSAAHTFRRHNTTVHPRGSTATIVTSGPFRISRNPMYLSLLVLYLGITLLAHLTWGFIFLPLTALALHFLVILPEERYLIATFGSAYTIYQSQVRRWI